jgi:hypothetical protein
MTQRPQLKRTLGIAMFGTLAWMIACSDDSDDDGGGGLGNSGTAGTATGKGGTSGTGGTTSGKGGTGNVAGTGGTSAGSAGTSAGSGGSVAGAAGTAGSAGTAGTAGNAGGSGTAGAAGSAGSAGAAGSAGTAGGGGTGGAIGATANYNFEVDTQGWTVDQEPANVVLTQTTTQHFGDTGTGSLQIAITPPASGEGGAAGEGGAGGDSGTGTSQGGEGGASGPPDVNYLVRITDPPLSPGQTIVLHIFVPDDPGVQYAQLVLQSKADWSGWDATPITLTPGMWTTVQHTVPLATVPPIRALVVQIGVAGTFSGNVFLDEISW